MKKLPHFPQAIYKKANVNGISVTTASKSQRSADDKPHYMVLTQATAGSASFSVSWLYTKIIFTMDGKLYCHSQSCQPSLAIVQNKCQAPGSEQSPECHTLPTLKHY